MNKCECGGDLYTLDDLDGMFCSKCNKHVEVNESDMIDNPLSGGFTESRAKIMRGVPMNYIRIGSETKGRIEIAIPCYFTPEESRKIIDLRLSDLKYAKDEIDRLGLDIYTGRR